MCNHVPGVGHPMPRRQTTNAYVSAVPVWPSTVKCFFFFQVSRRLHDLPIHYGLDEHRVLPCLACQDLWIVAKRDRRHSSPHVVFCIRQPAPLLIASSVDNRGYAGRQIIGPRKAYPFAGRYGLSDAWPALGPGVWHPGADRQHARRTAA
jgi:hypothetical protein